MLFLRVDIQLDWKIRENGDIDSWIVELIGKTSKNNQFLSFLEDIEEVEWTYSEDIELFQHDRV